MPTGHQAERDDVEGKASGRDGERHRDPLVSTAALSRVQENTLTFGLNKGLLGLCIIAMEARRHLKVLYGYKLCPAATHYEVVMASTLPYCVLAVISD